MSLVTRLYRNEVHYDFMRRRRRWYAISGLFVTISLASMLIRGFHFGIDFKGGAEFDFPANGHTVTQAKSVLDKTGIDIEVAQSLGSSPPQIRIQTKPLTEPQIQTVITTLTDRFGVNANDVNTTTVGSSWGSSVTTKAVEGLLVFLAAVIVYISFRFEPKMAFAAIIALLHDLLITAGIYSLVGFEVTPATVIAVLTILGFSLYDTVVVFDKVRENTAGLAIAGKKTYTEAANDAVNQTLMRSINTSLIALLPVASLLFIGAGLLGAGTLKDLALAQLVGLASGAYSSIFIATPLLVDLKERESAMKDLTSRVTRSRAAVTAREVRSERTSRSAAGSRRGTVVMDKPGRGSDGPGIDHAEDFGEDDFGDARSEPIGGIATPASSAMRPSANRGAARRPAKRAKPGRPGGKKRR